ncbi:gamma-glutamyltranspeptidase/glutathione hydrolase [Breoghania corrubedonensis]|uniref:Gamma-glutamyltranspeptidase/glutathione hydrolase n=1 Tax=Breoghania corrubedonensis TaxID=665038 RepID=A0A2T5VHT3_9HYPH|nr:gamma-glutamyltransferase family protein [Breoghania corrubedonensis]PTW63313.1 gamma-glutamyltranspeptidase/glutathione hydrolase [Breoghania corrubedonensis]
METITSTAGMVVAPHKAAAKAGAEVLRAGGTAVDAMIAAAATIAVVYPHMNAIGGDGFWLIAPKGRDPWYIDACGPAGRNASIEAYRNAECETVPTRGPLSALTVPGTVGGWAKAYEIAMHLGGGLPVGELLADARRRAREGIVVSRSQAALTAEKLAELENQPGFAGIYLSDGKPPAEGAGLRQERLSDTLDHLGHAGFDDFYRGDVAATLANDLEAFGSPVTRADLKDFEARVRSPLQTRIKTGQLFNSAPPTQGLASLIILGLYDRLDVSRAESFDHIHGLVEATKRAFLVRDRVVTDPAHMEVNPADFLGADWLDREVGKIERRRAAPWPEPASEGDTVWLGAIDAAGNAVSFIQSIYWEFGSGCVSPHTGILMQNRGASFSLDPDALNPLQPGRRPFHTLNPALARLDDGRTVVYGTMGGEGQPQTQAAIFSRAIMHGQDISVAIDAPRWLLGRTWGDETTSLRVESRFDPDLVTALERAGHEVVVMKDAYSDTMGHAGMIVRGADGQLLGAHDPRADGGAVAG